MRYTISRRLALLLLLALPLSAAESITILPLGDSITQGGTQFVSYRAHLVPAVTSQWPTAQFVGPNSDSISLHAGFGGKHSGALLAMIHKIYREHPADIVLIHSGHNSFAKDKPVKRIIQQTGEIIDQIHEINPKAVVILAQVIPSGKLPKYSYIPTLNQELAALIKKLQAQNRAVIGVDAARGFNWETQTIADKVHPNEAGALHIANAWLEALRPLLKQRTEKEQ